MDMNDKGKATNNSQFVAVQTEEMFCKSFCKADSKKPQ